MIEAAIFDLDGTLVDNMMVHHRAWQQILKEQGLELSIEEVKEKIHGINEEILERIFGDRFSVDERKRISEEKEARYRQVFLNDLKLIKGAENLINKFWYHNIPMAIASAAPLVNVEFVLNNLNLQPYFKEILHAGSVSNGKPHPEIYLKTAKQLGVQPERCIIFEDSPTGAKAASNAGVPVVVIKTTHDEPDFEGIDGIMEFIHDFEELELKKILSLNS